MKLIEYKKCEHIAKRFCNKHSYNNKSTIVIYVQNWNGHLNKKCKLNLCYKCTIMHR